MIDALADRPGVGRRRPVELFVGETGHEQVGFIREPLELLAELVDLGRQRENRRCRHRLGL